jgi:hypothetical protein
MLLSYYQSGKVISFSLSQSDQKMVIEKSNRTVQLSQIIPNFRSLKKS